MNTEKTIEKISQFAAAHPENSIAWNYAHIGRNANYTVALRWLSEKIDAYNLDCKWEELINQLDGAATEEAKSIRTEMNKTEREMLRHEANARGLYQYLHIAYIDYAALVKRYEEINYILGHEPISVPEAYELIDESLTIEVIFESFDVCVDDYRTEDDIPF